MVVVAIIIIVVTILLMMIITSMIIINMPIPTSTTTRPSYLALQLEGPSASASVEPGP